MSSPEPKYHHHCEGIDWWDGHFSIYKYDGDKDWYYFTGEYHHEIKFCPYCGVNLVDWELDTTPDHPDDWWGEPPT